MPSSVVMVLPESISIEHGASGGTISTKIEEQPSIKVRVISEALSSTP